MMHREIVDDKRWISERDYLDGLNFCTLLPGPEAQQLATYVGWRLYGVKGGLVTGLLFILPGAALILLLAQLYVLSADMPAVAGLLLGIKAAVLVIILDAMLKIGRRTLKSRVMQGLAGFVFLTMICFAVPFPLVIIGAALIGLVFHTHSAPLEASHPPEQGKHRQAVPFMLILSCLAAWWAPVLLAALVFEPSHLLVEIGVFFSKLAVITFGGAYALLAYLADEAITKGWVNAQQMLDGLGLAETTPGPTILVNPFIAFVAGWQKLGSTSLAWAAGGMALWTTFAPSFLWIFAGAPSLDKISANPKVRGALEGIGAAVVGIIGSVGVKFGLLYLFQKTHPITEGFFRLPIPAQGIEPINLCLTGLAFLILFYLRLSILKLIMLLALSGFVVSLMKNTVMDIF